MRKYFLYGILFLSILMMTGCGKNKIIGKWKAIDSKMEYYYIFNEDKTCSYEMTVARLDCTYEDDGKKLTILYKGNDTPSNYEYHFDDDTLIITTDGKDNKFIKQ